MSTPESTQCSLVWQDVRDWGVEGRGWDASQLRCFYGRLPARAKKSLPEIVWEQGHSPTGLSTRFATDATEIHARWELRSSQAKESMMTPGAYSGLDLYALARTGWRWAGAAPIISSRRVQACLTKEMPARQRTLQLYLPLRNPVVRLEIGVPREARFEGLAPRARKPVVYYGTSIIHGACASRPGMAPPSILGRKLDRPVINLGFSGNAKMEPAMAGLIAEIAADAFIIDPFPNMPPPLIRERAETFLCMLCHARPRTLVLLVNTPRVMDWNKPFWQRDQRAKDREIVRACRAAREAGCENLVYAPVANLLGEDGEGTVDGIHPNDLGCMRLAEHVLGMLLAARGKIKTGKKRS